MHQFCFYLDWAGWPPGVWAAWTQAIGSIAAILVAVLLPMLAERRRRKAADIEVARRARRGAALLHGELATLSRLLHHFMEQTDPARESEPDGMPALDFWKLDSDFLAVAPKLRALIESIDSFGPIDDDLYKLTVELSSFDSWMQWMSDAMTAGFNTHMGRTSIPDQRERAEKLAALARSIEREIESSFLVGLA